MSEEPEECLRCGSTADVYSEDENFDPLCAVCDSAGDETMVDLGGGMVVPLREVME